MIAAALLVALACLLWPGPHDALARAAPDRRCTPRPEDAGRSLRRRAVEGWNNEPRWLGRARDVDPFEVAAGYDLLAVCLRAGLPVATAAAVAAEHSPEPLAAGLARAAELLALGAEPEAAWAAETSADPARSVDEHFRDLATLARRASRSGSSLADGVAALAEATREQAQTQALARAERAGVTISGPLGLCFLPAFVCLGIVPVVVGLASGMFSQL